MRILIATGIFKPDVGGPATLAVELSKRLHSLGNKVTVVTYSSKPVFDFDHEFNFRLIRVTLTNNKAVNYLRYLFVIYREIKKADVIYSLDWFSVGVPLLIAAKLTGKKYIVRVGGAYTWEKYLAQGNTPVSLKGFYARGLHKKYRVMFFSIKKVLQHAAHVVFNTDIQRELYKKYYELKPEKTSTIYNAIPENRLSSLVQSYNMDYREHDKEIVFAGRFIKMKNIDSLIRAFQKFRDPNFKLVLIGDGPEKKNLENLVKSLNLEERIDFLPAMSQSDLYRRIAHCYVVVIPSWTDVSPNQAYECLSLGIPFLITKENYLNITADLPLTIEPGKIDDIAEKLNALLDEETYQKFNRALKQITISHPWERVVEEHLLVFRNVYHDRT